MAKGSVRKKGKKWYYRFYVEDASGKMVQKEYAGTESKSETEKLLRKALEDYENKKFVAKADSLTVGELLDMWAEEELKTGTLSNGTVENYLGAIRCIKKHPIAERKLKTVTAEHLQSFLDLLTFGGEFPDGKVRKGYSKDYIHSTTIYLWLISLTASKELSILLLKLLQCWSNRYIGFLSWTSRPYLRLITSSSFAAFVLCRLNCLWYVRVTPQ